MPTLSPPRLLPRRCAKQLPVRCFLKAELEDFIYQCNETCWGPNAGESFGTCDVALRAGMAVALACGDLCKSRKRVAEAVMRRHPVYWSPLLHVVLGIAVQGKAEYVWILEDLLRWGVNPNWEDLRLGTMWSLAYYLAYYAYADTEDLVVEAIDTLVEFGLDLSKFGSWAQETNYRYKRLNSTVRMYVLQMAEPSSVPASAESTAAPLPARLPYRAAIADEPPSEESSDEASGSSDEGSGSSAEEPADGSAEEPADGSTGEPADGSAEEPAEERDI